MPRAHDPDIARVLAELGVGPDRELGHGGEACVCALDDARVVRVHAAGARLALVAARVALLRELEPAAERLPFAIPRVLEHRTVAGHEVTIEVRLPGRSLDRELAASTGEARADLVRRYLDAAERIGDLGLARPWFGELCQPRPLRTRSFRAWLREAAQRSLARPDWARDLDGAKLAEAWPEPAPHHVSIVHLDAFPANMLAAEGHVSAVLDFGTLCVMGDRRLDPLTAAIYLEPAFTPEATDADRAIARDWLAEHGLLPLLDPARRWLAGYWSGALDLDRLQTWSRSVLRGA